ncbi:M23 family metallopeptidase [Gaopeijia maritima]|uniref:M23 family metallopeptidase n=1 Tax=Gaopeijia maritima TaxID=3119007 RepID=A0ABU9ED37_9BACT
MDLLTALIVAGLFGGGAAAAPAIPAAAPAADPAAAPPTLAAELSWLPERPVQGHLVRLVVTPSAGESLTDIAGEVGGEPVHFEPAAGGRWTALAPVPVDTEGTLSLRLQATDGRGTTTELSAEMPVEAGDYRHERLSVAPRLGSSLNAADQAHLDRDRAKAAEVARQAHASPRLWTSERVIPREDRVTSGFGNGRVFNGQVSSRHLGLDLDGDPGDVIVAPTRGVVALVDTFLLAGNIVYLNHGGGLVSGYFHLSEALVAEGDTVTAGTPIGRVGATGRVTGPHLHWVVRIGSTSLDPRSLLDLPLDATFDRVPGGR